MPAFPSTPDFVGLNAPHPEEYRIDGLQVEGTIPADVEGAFFRAIPNPVFPPMCADPTGALSPDGMVQAIRFEGGRASVQARFVQTPRHLAEKAAGRSLFGKYRNPFTDDPQVAGVDRATVNTTPLWHAGRLLMTKEDSLAFRVDPHTLETLGRHDFDARYRSQTFTAHTRVDPETGELFFFGFEADGLASTKVSYAIADRDGALVREQWFDAPYCAMIHDFAITERYAIFPVFPTTCDLERLRAGGDHWIHHPGMDSWLGVMPRYGDVSQMKWFKGPKGVHAFHILGAFEDAEGVIHMDHCLSDSNVFHFIRASSGIDLPQHEIGTRLARWSVRPDGPAQVTETVVGPPGDFPVIPAARQGRRHDHGWMLTMNPQRRAPPVWGGVGGAMLDTLLRVDFTGRPLQAYAHTEPNLTFNEPAHVPASRADHEGWLLTVVDRQNGPDDFEHACWIFDAGAVAAGPVARVALPRRVRPQIHGCWVGAAALAATRP
jgi:carotenoid cleavage dioxygenase-like enzyme